MERGNKMIESENVWITAKIGARIHKIREDRGISQSELAAQVNASQTQIANYERGEQDMPLTRLFDIAGILGVTAADLYGDDTI